MAASFYGEFSGVTFTFTPFFVLFARSLQLSSWALVLLTSERLISVWMPFKCKQLCSRRRIVIAWTVISLLFFGANMHFFFTIDLFVIVPEGGNITDAYVTCYFHDQFESFFIKLVRSAKLRFYSLTGFHIRLS